MSHSCADRHTDNVTTSARSVHPCSHTSTKMQTPFINRAVNDALVHAMPNMKQTLLQFVDTVHPWLVDSLLDDAPYLVVHWIEVRTVWWPQIRWNESRCCLLKKSHSVTRQFFNKNISQGSVATRLRCGGIFNYHCAANLPLSISVNEF